MSLAGKVAIVTGSSSGIGAGIAGSFAKEGAKVSLTGRHTDRLQEVAVKCRTFGTNNVTTTVGDITSDDVRKKLVKNTLEAFGTIDILVNNAGVFFPATLCDVTEEHYNDVMDINLKTPILLTALVSEHLLKNKGTVINISSVSSEMYGALTSMYCTSKAALEKYTKCLALEMGPKGVRVNAISPGYVPSKLTRHLPEEAIEAGAQGLIKATAMGRGGTAEEIGRAAVFLASDNASFITGQILVVDGGVRLTPVLVASA